VNSASNFSESQSSLGFAAQAQSRGFNYGFTASVNIFDGFNQRRKRKVASLLIENAKLNIDQQIWFSAPN
jgi:outer membrane protein TolC